MATLNDIKPTSRNLVFDLVQEAGFDVYDWIASSKSDNGPAANPKYCYNWSFVEPGKVVILNLWFDKMKFKDGEISYDLNPKSYAKINSGKTAERAKNLDNALRTAVLQHLPVRVIVCDGDRHDKSDPDSGPSKVKHRLLDPEEWHISSYDNNSGECTVVRGLGDYVYIDQFTLERESNSEVKRRETSVSAYVRNPRVRQLVLDRAGGRCEYCNSKGFKMTDGRSYLETHHIVPLHEKGADTTENVTALCPNHHREAHYGADCIEMRETLLGLVHK